MRTIVTTLISFLASTAAYAGSGRTAVDFSRERAVLIDDVIDGSLFIPVASRLNRLSTDGTGNPIDVVISSPGGSLVIGFLLTNEMENARARGSKVRCFVPTLAASMAFQLLLHCDERYVSEKALLLWHGVRVMSEGEQITAEGAAQLWRDISANNRVIFSELESVIGACGMPSDEIRYHFLAETLHVGEVLAARVPRFVTAVPALPGPMTLVLQSAAAKARQLQDRGPEGRIRRFAPGTLIYMWRGK
jgi:ATP-dependent protease ClpP protease subunit